MVMFVLTCGPHVLRYHCLNRLSPDGHLLCAINFQDREEFEVAFADGASPDAVEPVSGYSALMIAGCVGNRPFARELIARGASIHARDRRGATALAHAAYAGHIEVVRVLLAAGARVDDRDHDGRTALAYAVINARETTAELLLERGAAVDDADVDGATPLMLAAAGARSSPKLITILIQAGADPARTDRQRRTAWDYAVEAERQDLAALLAGACRRN